MIALASLLKSRTTWGVGIALGVLLAVWGNGKLGYRRGFDAGVAMEHAAAQSDATLARAALADAQATAAEATDALTDTIGQLRVRMSLLSEEAALARGNYRAALAAYERDKAARADSVPLTPEQQVCDELARACAVAVQLAQNERDTLSLTLATAERLVRVQDSIIAAEPQRTALSTQEALAAQRAAFTKPSRLTWGVGGAALGALLTWVVIR